MEKLPSPSKIDHGIIWCWRKEGDGWCSHGTTESVRCHGTKSGSQWRKSEKLSSHLPPMTTVLHMALVIQGLSHLMGLGHVAQSCTYWWGLSYAGDVWELWSWLAKAAQFLCLGHISNSQLQVASFEALTETLTLISDPPSLSVSPRTDAEESQCKYGSENQLFS